jgi:predicted enzyme related to lactoylglutathione lyase
VSLRPADVVIDCSEFEPLATFWTAALGWSAKPVNEQYLAIVPPERGLSILLQRVPEPKVVKNRVHVDFRTEDLAAEVARLTGLGARVLAKRNLGAFRWVVLEDPVGNEFCVNAG